MKHVNLKIILLAVGLAFTGNAMSQTIVNAAGDTIVMTSEYHSVEMKGIKDQYEMEKADCALISGGSIKLCNAQAMAKQKIDLAKLQNDYRPSVKNRYNLAVVKANADYSVAIEKCADMLSEEKATCMRDAKIAKTDDLVNAKAGMTLPMPEIMLTAPKLTPIETATP